MTLAVISSFLQLSSAVDELKIEVHHKPEECLRVSKKNDMLTMHYRGTLEDGTEFDSRYAHVIMSTPTFN